MLIHRVLSDVDSKGVAKPEMALCRKKIARQAKEQRMYEASFQETWNPSSDSETQ